MSLEMFVVMVLPLILYVLIELKYGMRAGVIAAIAASMLILVYAFVVWRDLDSMLLTEAALLVLLGGISYKLNSSVYFKMQPTVVGLVMGAYLGYFQIFGTPVLVRMMPLMAKMNPQAHLMMANESGVQFLSALSGQSAWMFALHGVFVGWVGWKYSSFLWVVSRLTIYPLMIAVVAINGLRYLSPT